MVPPLPWSLGDRGRLFSITNSSPSSRCGHPFCRVWLSGVFYAENLTFGAQQQRTGKYDVLPAHYVQHILNRSCCGVGDETSRSSEWRRKQHRATTVAMSVDDSLASLPPTAPGGGEFGAPVTNRTDTVDESNIGGPSRLKLKVRPSPPQYPYADTFFALEVSERQRVG